MDAIQTGGLIFGFLAAIIFILEDVLPSIHKFFFRKLNIGLERLSNFNPPTPERRTEMAMLTWKEDGFLEAYKMLRQFFPNLPLPLREKDTEGKQEKVVGIYIEKSLNLNTPQGVTPTPVFVWDTSKKVHYLMSKDALFWYASNYRQRVLNRIGFFLLILSIIMQLGHLLI